MPPLDPYPSLELAYEYVRPSYDVMLRRIEAVEGRVRAVMTLAATILFAVVAFLGSDKAAISRPLTSGSLVMAAVFFAVIEVWGLISSLPGELRVVNPTELYDTWLSLEPQEFKKNALWFAARDFRNNARRVNGLAGTANYLAIFLIGEMVMLGLWVAGINSI